jgi:hypothetical protein
MHRAPHETRLPPWARRLRWELGLVAGVAVIGGSLYVLLSLAVYGHVNL